MPEFLHEYGILLLSRPDFSQSRGGSRWRNTSGPTTSPNVATQRDDRRVRWEPSAVRRRQPVSIAPASASRELSFLSASSVVSVSQW